MIYFTIKDNYKERCAVLKFFDAPHGGGIVKKINGIDYLEQNPAIKEYQLHFGIGDTIVDCINDSARIGFYIACAETKDKLDKIIDEVKQQVTIELCEKEIRNDVR